MRFVGLILLPLIMGFNTAYHSLSLKQQNKTYQYLALGDSYSVGEGIDPKDSWCNQLSDLLQKKGKSVTTDIVAETGWTTSDLNLALSKIDKQYDFITLLIGVNNQYRGDDTASFRKDLRKIIEKSLNLTGNKKECLLVLSLPDWSVTPYGEKLSPQQISREIDDYNHIVKDETQRAGATFINITPVSKTAYKNPPLLAPDHLHFSRLMYKSWAYMVVPYISRIMENSTRAAK